MFKYDSGWVVNNKTACYSEFSREVIVKDNVFPETIKSYFDNEKKKWYGQEFYVVYDSWPLVKAFKCIDSGD